MQDLVKGASERGQVLNTAEQSRKMIVHMKLYSANKIGVVIKDTGKTSSTIDYLSTDEPTFNNDMVFVRSDKTITAYSIR
ncbi:MAG: hypothetical protein WDO15_11915 [Bacteroidota bacterium]